MAKYQKYSIKREAKYLMFSKSLRKGWFIVFACNPTFEMLCLYPLGERVLAQQWDFSLLGRWLLAVMN